MSHLLRWHILEPRFNLTPGPPLVLLSFTTRPVATTQARTYTPGPGRAPSKSIPARRTVTPLWHPRHCSPCALSSFPISARGKLIAKLLSCDTTVLGTVHTHPLDILFTTNNTPRKQKPEAFSTSEHLITGTFQSMGVRDCSEIHINNVSLSLILILKIRFLI